MKNFKVTTLAGLAAALFCITATEGYTQTPQPDMSQYILTPKPADTPRINGARVFGVRPGSEFMFTVAATGKRPMKFEAEGLPKGLKLDPETGRITGRIKKEGEYTVRLTATNALGSNERDLRIVVGDRIALTPPMGWNSWNCSVFSSIYTLEGVSTLPTPKVNVIDSVGAGDSFSGALTGALLAGKSIAEAHRIAVDTAAYVCTCSGAWTPPRK